MNHSRTLLVVAFLLPGCAAQQVSRPRRQGIAESARVDRKEMEQNDARLRAQFAKIAIGMSPSAVRHLMGTEPDASRDGVWQFRLSRASDRFGEMNWTLAVRFENGSVSQKWSFYTDVIPKALPAPTTELPMRPRRER